MNNLNGLVGIKEESKGDILILKLNGRLDAVSSPAVERKIFDYLSRDKHKLLLDFSGIDYLSSAGLRMLLSVTKKIRSLSGKLILFSVTTNVVEILKMSGFDHVLEIASTEEEGVRRF